MIVPSGLLRFLQIHFRRIKSYAVILHSNADAAVLCPSPSQAAAKPPPRLKTVDHSIFHKRLNRQPWYEAV